MQQVQRAENNIGPGTMQQDKASRWLWRLFVVGQSRESALPRTNVSKNSQREMFTTPAMNNADLEASGVQVAEEVVDSRQGKCQLQVAVGSCEGKIRLIPPKGSAVTLHHELEIFLQALPPRLTSELHCSPAAIIEDQFVDLSLDTFGVGLDKKMFISGLANLVAKFVHPKGESLKQPLHFMSPKDGTPAQQTLAGSLASERSGLRPCMQHFKVLEVEPDFTLAEDQKLQEATGGKYWIGLVHGTTGQGKTTFIQEMILRLNHAGFPGRADGYDIDSGIGGKERSIHGMSLDLPERKQEIIVVTPADQKPNILTSLTSFSTQLTQFPGRQMVLFIDNAHEGVEWPVPESEVNRQLLDKLDEIKEQLRTRADGSMVVIAGEHLPRDLDKSLTEGHRLTIFEDRLAEADVVLTKNRPNVLASKLMGKMMVNSGWDVLAARLSEKKSLDQFEITTSYEARCTEVINLVLSHGKVRGIFKKPAISRFLSRSHLHSVGELIASTMQDQIHKGILSGEKGAYLQLSGKNLVWQDGALDIMAEQVAGNLVSIVNETVAGKTRELAANTPLATSATGTETLATPGGTVGLETIRQALTSRVETRRGLEMEISERQQQIDRMKSEERVIETAKALMEGEKGHDWQVLSHQASLIRSLIPLLMGGEEVSIPAFERVDWNELLDSLASFESLETRRKGKVKWEGLKAVFGMVDSPSRLEQALPAIKALSPGTRQDWMQDVLSGVKQIESASRLIGQESVAGE